MTERENYPYEVLTGHQRTQQVIKRIRLLSRIFECSECASQPIPGHTLTLTSLKAMNGAFEGDCSLADFEKKVSGSFSQLCTCFPV